MISEANQLWYFGRHIADFLKIPHILRIHSIRGLYAKTIIKAYKWSNRNLVKLLKEIGKCPISMLHALALAQVSDYTITLTYIEERFLRRYLIRNVSTVEGTYVSFPEEVEAPAFRLDDQQQYVLVVKSPPSILSLIKHKINLPVISRGSTILRNYVSTSKWASLIKGSLIIVRPSIYSSGLPVGLVEALAYGKVMLTTSAVASKLKGLRNWTHIIVEDDFAKYPSIINLIAKNEELRRHIEINARYYFEKHLNLMKHCEKLERVLYSTLHY